MENKVRTRFAPSPTGRMHVGNLRTALYAYLIAKHEGGDFILRVEDTDQERFVEGALDIIYRTMEKTGLLHDEGPDKDGGFGPYVQSERQASGLYLDYAKQLVEQGDAYYCFCDKERLESLKTSVSDDGTDIVVYDKHCLGLSKEEVEKNLAEGKPWVIRLNVPNEGETTFHDEIYGNITVPNNELDDMILIKSDGFPTYNFANVIDDHLMGITHVVRGNEYLSSVPKYNRLYEAFGWEIPVYVHCPLITDENHKKLSKRCGHASYEDLIDQGFVSEAVVNYVALLGFIIRDLDEQSRSVVASRKDAMLKKRQMFYLNENEEEKPMLYPGRVVEARVIAVAPKVVRLEVFGVEVSVRARDMAWEWMVDAGEKFQVGDLTLVMVNKINIRSLEEIDISVDAKGATANTNKDNLKRCVRQGKYVGIITDIYKGTYFIRLNIGVNAVAHSCNMTSLPSKRDEVGFVVTRINDKFEVAEGIITRMIKRAV